MSIHNIVSSAVEWAEFVGHIIDDIMDAPAEDTTVSFYEALDYLFHQFTETLKTLWSQNVHKSNRNLKILKVITLIH
jgi:hypothetical protein